MSINGCHTLNRENFVRTHNIVDLSDQEKLMKLLETYHKVVLNDSDDFPAKLTWCLEHCQNKFRDIRTQEGMFWYFEKEEDATLFALKWS